MIQMEAQSSGGWRAPGGIGIPWPQGRISVPVQLWLGGQLYETVLVRNLLGVDGARARTQRDIGVIEIDASLGETHMTRAYLHEVIHGLAEGLGWHEKRREPLEAEENVTALAAALSSLLREWGITFDFSALPVRDAARYGQPEEGKPAGPPGSGVERG